MQFWVEWRKLKEFDPNDPKNVEKVLEKNYVEWFDIEKWKYIEFDEILMFKVEIEMVTKFGRILRPFLDEISSKEGPWENTSKNSTHCRRK